MQGWGPWWCDFNFPPWMGWEEGLKCITHMCINPICYCERVHVTGRGHGFHRGDTWGLELGAHRASPAFITDIFWLYLVLHWKSQHDQIRSTACTCRLIPCVLPFPLSVPTLTHSLLIIFLYSSLTGKILFRRSHVRDVAMKRLRFIDDYCRVNRPYCQHPSQPDLTLGNPRPLLCMWGVKSQDPHCLFTYFEHGTWNMGLQRAHAAWSCVYQSVESEFIEATKVSAWWGNVPISRCCSWRLVYFHMWHSQRSAAT